MQSGARGPRGPARPATFGPVRRRFGAVPAEPHATPAPGMALAAIIEHERAACRFALADMAEVRIAEDVTDHLGDRLQQSLHVCPAPLPAPPQGPRLAPLVLRPTFTSSFDLAIAVVAREQAIERFQLIDSA